MRTIRFLASVVLLCSLTFLIIDGAFYLLASSARGSLTYFGIQIGAQVLLVVLMIKRIIVIYTGPSEIITQIPT